MANFIKNLNVKRNHWDQDGPSKVRSKYVPVNKVGDLEIKEGETAKGHKMIVVTDKNEGVDKKDKEKFIRNTFGDNPTKNGHGTVVTVGEADK